MKNEIIIEAIVNQAEKQCEHLECDGTTRVLHYLLNIAGIEHKVFSESIFFQNEILHFHYWIEIEDFYIIDLKARMWFDNPAAPHGLFMKADTVADYQGKEFHLLVTEDIYNILIWNPKVR